MSKNCYHDTSVSNVRCCLAIEIVKLRIIVCTITQEQNGLIGHSLCVEPVSRRSSHSCSSENSSQQYLCCGNATVAKVLTVAGRKTDECISPRSEASATSFCFSKNFLDPILSLSDKSERCQTAQHQLLRFDHVRSD